MAPVQDPRPSRPESAWSAGGPAPAEAAAQVTRPLGARPVEAGPAGTGPLGTGATQTSAAGWRPSSVSRDAPTTVGSLPPVVPPAQPPARPAPAVPVVDEPVVGKPVTDALPWESIAPDVQDVSEKPEKADKKPEKKPDKAGASTPKGKRGMWSYTLLHVLVLAVVAFVLGWIIWMLLTKDDNPLGAMGVGVGPQATVTSGPQTTITTVTVAAR